MSYYHHCCWPLIPSNNAVSKKERMAAAAFNHNLFYILYHINLPISPSSGKVPPHPIPSHPIPPHPIRGVKQRGIIAAPGDVLVPNWFPGWPLRPFYGCISLPTFPFFIETSENFETIFSFSLSKFGLVIVELIMLASLSNLLTFTSTRLSVILIYNFSQIVEKIWRKKLYNCVSISGHVTVPKARRLFLDSLVLMKSLLSIYLSLWCHCPQAWARSTAKMVLQQKSVALNQQLPAVFWFGTGFLLTGRRKTLVQKKTVRRLFVQVELIQRRVWKELLGRQLPTRQVAGKKNCSCGMRFLESATRGLVR